jgi:hypothetical protein
MRRADLHQMTLDAWGSGTMILVLLLLLELSVRGFVSRFFNMAWPLLFVLAASLAALATHPGATSKDHSPRPPREARALLQLAAVGAGVLAWIVLPKGLALPWRVIASVSLLVAALVAVPSLMKEE